MRGQPCQITDSAETSVSRKTAARENLDKSETCYDAMMETVALKRQDAELEMAELKMLIFVLRVTRMDSIRNEYLRGTAQVECFGERQG